MTISGELFIYKKKLILVNLIFYSLINVLKNGIYTFHYF